MLSDRQEDGMACRVGAAKPRCRERNASVCASTSCTVVYRSSVLFYFFFFRLFFSFKIPFFFQRFTGGQSEVERRPRERNWIPPTSAEVRLRLETRWAMERMRESRDFKSLGIARAIIVGYGKMTKGRPAMESS